VQCVSAVRKSEHTVPDAPVGVKPENFNAVIKEVDGRDGNVKRWI
jgi:hypothetical protein